jgi:hypothetical protein
VIIKSAVNFLKVLAMAKGYPYAVYNLKIRANLRG